jgi:hypothetical protein
MDVNNSKEEAKEWEPFTDYDTPCYVLYEGDIAIWDDSLSDRPLKLLDQEILK